MQHSQVKQADDSRDLLPPYVWVHQHILSLVQIIVYFNAEQIFEISHVKFSNGNWSHSTWIT